MAVELASFRDERLVPPSDLADVYVVKGKHMLEAHYGVRKSVMLRWLSELDEGLLKRKRQAFVRNERSANRLRRVPSSTLRRLTIVQDARPADIRVVRMAADFLRCVRNGGWIISRTQFGDWLVGMRKLSPYELIEMAIAKGFDAKAAALQAEGSAGVEG